MIDPVSLLLSTDLSSPTPPPPHFFPPLMCYAEKYRLDEWHSFSKIYIVKAIPGNINLRNESTIGLRQIAWLWGIVQFHVKKNPVIQVKVSFHFPKPENNFSGVSENCNCWSIKTHTSCDLLGSGADTSATMPCCTLSSFSGDLGFNSLPHSENFI